MLSISEGAIILALNANSTNSNAVFLGEGGYNKRNKDSGLNVIVSLYIAGSSLILRVDTDKDIIIALTFIKGGRIDNKGYRKNIRAGYRIRDYTYSVAIKPTTISLVKLSLLLEDDNNYRDSDENRSGKD
ncbi:uncharacterized protein RAG0_17165 [Rhynchosporium agropyri]|uniref:Uncharacterized protein n=1 Tax=Rhynchosporium agropyri TaxID=914238 RepID=A0A1E1LT30_9HELO|nr:uncharacterized protein RAG0_17165 [Rhynchosporium agropyri]